MNLSTVFSALDRAVSSNYTKWRLNTIAFENVGITADEVLTRAFSACTRRGKEAADKAQYGWAAREYTKAQNYQAEINRRATQKPKSPAIKLNSLSTARDHHRRSAEKAAENGRFEHASSSYRAAAECQRLIDGIYEDLREPKAETFNIERVIVSTEDPFNKEGLAIKVRDAVVSTLHNHSSRSLWISKHIKNLDMLPSTSKLRRLVIAVVVDSAEIAGEAAYNKIMNS